MIYSNTMDFDYIDNYKAVLACILSKKEITIESAVNIVTGQQIGRRIRSESKGKRKGHYSIKVYVKDTITEEVKEFDSAKETAEYLGVSRATVSKNLDKYKEIKNRYILISER